VTFDLSSVAKQHKDNVIFNAGGMGMQCSACGSSFLVEGELTRSDGDTTKFIPTDESKLKRAFGIGGRRVRTYGCPRCGHLQFAVEFTEDDLKKYQSFEGEQQRSAVEPPESQ
jgi:hypothetical protein